MGILFGKLVCVDGEVDESKYRARLEDNRLAATKDLRRGRRLTFQQDGNTKTASYKIMALIETCSSVRLAKTKDSGW